MTDAPELLLSPDEIIGFCTASPGSVTEHFTSQGPYFMIFPTLLPQSLSQKSLFSYNLPLFWRY